MKIPIFPASFIETSNIINYIEENIGAKLTKLCLREDFMNLALEAREVKAKTNEWDYIKLKPISTAKENTSKIKKQ